MLRLGLTRQFLNFNKTFCSFARAAEASPATYKQLAPCKPRMGKKRKLDAVKHPDGFFCPACNQMALKWPVFSRHLQRCCPDLLSGKELLCDFDLQQVQVEDQNISEALKDALAEEEVLRKECVSTHLYFMHACPGIATEIVLHCALTVPCSCCTIHDCQS